MRGGIATGFAVLLQVIGLICTLVALSVTWWTSTIQDGSKIDRSLWDYEKGGSGVVEPSRTWDTFCDFPVNRISGLGENVDNESECMQVKAARAVLIIGGICELGALGCLGMAMVAGNQMAMVVSGGIGIVAMFCTLVCAALGLSIGSRIEERYPNLSQGSGYISIVIAFICNLMGCTLTCVDLACWVHQLAIEITRMENQLAAEGKRKHTATRAQKFAETSDQEAQTAIAMYEAQALRQLPVAEAEEPFDGLSGGMSASRRERVPKVILRKVLFEQQNDDEGIPTEMLEAAFREIDVDASGSIDLVELVEALRECGLQASQAATDTILKEIDKNSDGGVDIHEFIEFFRSIEELTRYQKKTQARQQFCTFFLNFAFLGAIIVEGVLLMIYIDGNKDSGEATATDSSSIIEIVLIACSIVLGILFCMVILVPILMLILGPHIRRMNMQYELSKQLRAHRMPAMPTGGDEAAVASALRASGGGDLAPGAAPGAATFEGSYRVKKSAAALTNAPHPRPDEPMGSTHQTLPAPALQHLPSGTSVPHTTPSFAHYDSQRMSGGYDPEAYREAKTLAAVQEMRGEVPTSFSPMQVRDVGAPRSSPAGVVLPGAPMLALADAGGR